MGLADFISTIVTSITKTTFQFNKTLDVLIDRFKDACPTTKELKALIVQKNQINSALQQIEQKIATLNKVAAGSEIAADALSKGKTLIKQIPIPSSVPPGVGLPLSVMNNFSDALDNLGTLIDKEKASLDTIPDALDLISKDVGEVITKLNEFSVALDKCLEDDPGITQEDLNSLTTDTTNFVGVITDEALTEVLNNPPGLLYGDYYLRLKYVEVSQTTLNNYNQDITDGGELANATSILSALLTTRSFDKKQIVAINKEAIPPPEGEFYNSNIPIERLFGDKSFSSSNTVLVNEMKWLIDTKDLIFPPPPPAEDPLKAIYKEGQIAILMAIYGVPTREEAEELYEMAWELSQNRGPQAGYYSTLLEEAFNNSRTTLEQAVVNEGYEWKQGDRILDATIKNLFIPSSLPEEQKESLVSLLKSQGKKLYDKAKNIGGSYNPSGKRWENDGFEFESLGLYPYSERLAATAENNFNDATLGNAFVSLRPEMARRKPKWQAVFEVANVKSIDSEFIIFNDPLKEYFFSKGFGYNTPIINTIPILGDSNSPITTNELEELYELEKIYAEQFMTDNWDYEIDPWTTPNGVNTYNVNAYAKNRLLVKLKEALGIDWYNSSALLASQLPFWYLDGNPNSNSSYYNDPNYYILPEGSIINYPTKNDPWYFEFGKNSLPIPSGS